MIKIKEVILVEGRYDKIAVSSVFDTEIFETSGFGIFNDSQKQRLIKEIADKRGLIILTDSDSAGFVIRNCVKSFCNNKNIKNAYIPAIEGKEKRKRKKSSENYLGVEGVGTEIIKNAVLRVCTVIDSEADVYDRQKLSMADLYELGLSGKKESSVKRTELLKKLNYPERISGKAFLDIINSLYSKSEIIELISDIYK